MNQPYNHIDLTYLKQIANGSNEFMAQMISIFIAQTPELLSSIDLYLQKNDLKLLKGVVHKMKPSFTFMGIKEVESKVALVEKYCETGTHLTELPLLISEIKAICNIAIQELETEKKLFT